MRVSVIGVLSVCGIISLATGLSADPWKIDATANIGTTINSYSNSWSGGEAGSFTWNSQFLGVAERQFAGTWNTKTTLNLQFGQTKVQDKTTKRWSEPQKSTDLIDAEELLRYIAPGWVVNPFASARVITQFVDGSDTAMDRHINPLDITEALGASRTLAKTDRVEWSSRLGIAARQHVDREHLDPVSMNRSTQTTKDGGVELDMNLNAVNKQKWASLISSLRLYEAVVTAHDNATLPPGHEDDWRAPHVQWENTLTLSFKKYLMVNLVADAYYDKTINTAVRLKEALTVGLTYIYAKK